jgi:hypothetical protein
MDGEYSYEWAELRKLQRRLLIVAIAGVTIVALVPVTWFVHGTVATALGWTLYVAWVAFLFGFFITMAEYGNWSCPRCGKPFHYEARRFNRWADPFARRCPHCGLPKWVESDPDPQRKHEFDPFRIDGVLKLGDPGHKL